MTSMPFGLLNTLQVFAWIANLLRDMGIRVTIYLEDFLLVNQDPRHLWGRVKKAITLLKRLDWVRQVLYDTDDTVKFFSGRIWRQ